MFDYFTFGTTPKTVHDAQQYSGPYEPISPDDISPSTQQKPRSEGYVSRSWHYNAFNDTHASQWTLPSPPASDDFDFAEELDRCLYVTKPKQPAPTPINRDCRRLKRQRNSRLLYTSTYTKRMESMLEDMALGGSQCNVSGHTEPMTIRQKSISHEVDHGLQHSSAQPRSVIEDVDEGFHEDDGNIRKRPLEELMVSLNNMEGLYGHERREACEMNRAGDPSKCGPPRVMKHIRQRRRAR